MRLTFSLLLLVCFALAAHSQDDPKPKIKAADRQKIRATKETMRKLAGELNTAKSMLQAYPEKLDELVKNQIVEKLPKDGWDNDFAYSRNKDSGYELVSYGADKRIGGENADADLVMTQDGLKQNLTKDQAEAIERKRLLQRQVGFRVLATFEMRVLGQMVIQYRRDKSAWPEQTKDFRPAGESPQEKMQAKCFDDPWGAEYGFKVLPNDNFAIICLGADGKEGGAEHNADFVITERDVRAEDSGRDYDDWRGYNREQDWRVEDLADGVRRFAKASKRLPRELGELVRATPRIRTDIPKDKFGNDYIYITIGDDEFYIIGLGSDARPGGMGDGADVIAPRPGQVVVEREEYVRPEVEVKPEDSEENKALVNVAETLMQDLIAAVNEHKKEKNAWPASFEDIKDRLPGKAVPQDPWDNSFEFEQLKNAAGEVTGVRVICRGCDKAVGGASAAMDFAINDAGERVEVK